MYQVRLFFYFGIPEFPPFFRLFTLTNVVICLIVAHGYNGSYVV